MHSSPRQTFREWSTHLPKLLWAYKGRVDPTGRKLFSLRTRRMTAWLLLKGHVHLETDGASVEVRKGKWVFFCSDFHKHHFSPHAEIISVSLSIPEEAKQLWTHKPYIVEAGQHPHLQPLAERLIRTIEADESGTIGPRLLNHELPYSKTLAITGTSILWAQACFDLRTEVEDFEPIDAKHPKVAEALIFLKESSMSHGYSEKELADTIGLSTGYLEHLFVKELGMTPRRIWEQNRIEVAQTRVRHTQVAFKQIAYELGFNSQQHFSNWFRKVTGCSPRQWRNSNE